MSQTTPIVAAQYQLNMKKIKTQGEDTIIDQDEIQIVKANSIEEKLEEAL